MRNKIMALILLVTAAVGIVVPCPARCQDAAQQGAPPRMFYDWETWPKKTVPPSDAGREAPQGEAPRSGKADAEAAAGAAAGAKAGQDASAGILSGTTGKIAIIGALIIGGAVALGGGGGGGSTTTNH